MQKPALQILDRFGLYLCLCVALQKLDLITAKNPPFIHLESRQVIPKLIFGHEQLENYTALASSQLVGL